jgi:hypothetical protein
VEAGQQGGNSTVNTTRIRRKRRRRSMRKKRSRLMTMTVRMMRSMQRRTCRCTAQCSMAEVVAGGTALGCRPSIQRRAKHGLVAAC